MNGTYQKNGVLCGHFSRKRQLDLEDIGRDQAEAYFTWLGAQILPNDKVAGTIDYEKADFKVILPNQEVLLVEAATKASDIWHYVFEGVDIECRKLKYIKQLGPQKLVVAMTKQDGSELLLIPGMTLHKATECGMEYKGQGKIKSSNNFKMPEHGCHKVRKFCRGPGGGTEEDFYRIPFKYVTHIGIECSGKKYKILQKKVSLE